MKNSQQDINLECNGKYLMLRTLGARSGFLFLNFFLIIMVLYQLKPASRSLFIEYLGSGRLPYAWIAMIMALQHDYQEVRQGTE